MIKITKKEEDFRIYVENDNNQYISSSFILKHEKHPSKRIYFEINLGKDVVWEISLSRSEIAVLSELLTEVCKHLNDDSQLKLNFD